jgi:hypothetical protein
MYLHTRPSRKQVIGLGRMNTELGSGLTDEHLQNELKDRRFEVFTEMQGKMVIFWVVAQCSLLAVYQHFR